jgi:hypothetical protein
MDADFALDSLAVKDHLVAYLVAGSAMAFLPDYSGNDRELSVPAL